MNRTRVSLLSIVLVVGCGKQEAAPTEAAPKPAASASASASATPKPKEAAPLSLKGSYAAKQGEVRIPEDAPPFLHPTGPEGKEALGDGELELTLPPKEGAVVGKGKGALGAQLFEGWLEGDRLNGTLRPAEGAAPAMWGLVQATVEGTGDARVVKGSLRASGRDGKVVREATFTLDKK